MRWKMTTRKNTTFTHEMATLRLEQVDDLARSPHAWMILLGGYCFVPPEFAKHPTTVGECCTQLSFQMEIEATRDREAPANGR